MFRQPAIPLARILRVPVATLLLSLAGFAHAEIPFHSAHVLVVDESTGQVLFDKDSAATSPMASLTKLLTAMVVLDAHQDLTELLTVDAGDMDTLKHTHSGVAIGTALTRGKLLELALIASDNHAASSLARHYPGGMPAFLEAARAKLLVLKLTRTSIEEPTGLSPLNRSSAADLVAILGAAATYPEIARFTSQRSSGMKVNGRQRIVRNTNPLVGLKGWDILLSKTGFTNEAGRCIAMRLRAAGRTVLLVLLDSSAVAQRSQDAINVTRWLSGDLPSGTLQVKVAVNQAKKKGFGRAKGRLTHPASTGLPTA